MNNSKINVGTLASSKSMIGAGNTKQEVKLHVLINEPGSYETIFSWQNFIIKNNTNNQQSIITTFNTSDAMQFGPNHYYQQNYFHFSAFPAIISFLMVFGIFGCVVYVVYSKEDSYKKKSQSRVNPNIATAINNNPIRQKNRDQIRVASFCSNCGSKIIVNAPYCPDCGTKLE